MWIAGFTTDLHNFAFLGKNPRLGCASDWVWFNVPHGPLKQIDSFIAAQKACEEGREEVRLSEHIQLVQRQYSIHSHPDMHRTYSKLYRHERVIWMSTSVPWKQEERSLLNMRSLRWICFQTPPKIIPQKAKLAGLDSAFHPEVCWERSTAIETNKCTSCSLLCSGSHPGSCFNFQNCFHLAFANTLSVL